MSLLAGFYFISKSTLVLLIAILNVHLDDEMILPLCFLFTLIILNINKYLISLIKYASFKKVLSCVYYRMFASFMVPVYPKSYRNIQVSIDYMPSKCKKDDKNHIYTKESSSFGLILRLHIIFCS